MCENLSGRILSNRYEIHGLLGKGGIASVYAAHDDLLDRQVAVKVFQAGYALPPDRMETFIAEARRIAKLDHPHVLGIYDQGTETVDDVKRFYLVMQLAQGGTLADRLETGPLSTDETERILRQACAALDYAHSQQVLHLDLKPDNILFDEQGSVKVADFGLARLIRQTTHAGADAKPSAQDYMSPEQLSGNQTTFSSDVYALGLILHQMLTSELPERQLVEPDLAARLFESLPPAIRPVIEKATHSNPQQRYGTAGELAEAFTAALYPFPDHLVALREALRELGRLCEDRPRLDEGRVATYACARVGLFSALGYGKPGKEKLLERRADTVWLHAFGHEPLAVVRFVSPGCSPEDRLAQLNRQLTANRLPDVGVLCDGRELWLHQRAETDFYPRPTLRVRLREATDADARAVYEWLGRREMQMPRVRAPARTRVKRRAWGWLVAGGLALLMALVGLVWFGAGRERFSSQTRGTLFARYADGIRAPQHAGLDLSVTPVSTGAPTHTPSTEMLSSARMPLPSPTLAPSITPSATPSSTSIPTPHLTVSDDTADLYDGPGQNYRRQKTVAEGDMLPILGRSEDGVWLWVDCLGWKLWIAVQSIATDADVQALPVIEAPPTPVNHPPSIQNVLPAAEPVQAWGVTTVTCQAFDLDEDVLTYTWEASDGFIAGEGESVTYNAPETIGIQAITVTVRDEHGSEAEDAVQVQIVPATPPPGMSEPARVFGQIWYESLEARRKLGWATGEGTTPAAQQSFERGVMFWRKDKDEIYVLAQGGSWQMHIDTWEEGMDEYSCPDVAQRQTPPTPIRGFGKVWCEQLGDPDADIGWAVNDERAYDAYWQSFERGLMWQGREGYIYALYHDGSWQLHPHPISGVSSNRSNVPPQQFHVGDRVRVCTAYDRLAVRTRPWLGSSELTLLEPGSLLTVVGGPSYADGWPWWRVRTNDGIVGWVAEGGDEVDPYFICPEQ
jgi:serine/threonine protein kinase